MFNLLFILYEQRLWDFPGGIYPPEMKKQSSNIPLRSIPLPNKLIIPLKQHLGPEGELLVSPGDRVLRGQPLTTGKGHALPIHATTSGKIEAIIPHCVAHPSNLLRLCIILLPDGKDQWFLLKKLLDYQNYSLAQLLNRIHESGIAGLGGAGFPTASKFYDEGYNNKIETIIINGAECEPYITADDRLMQEHSREIVKGMAILNHMLKPKRLLIGIEDNKLEAISSIKEALCEHSIGKLCVIPTKYPSGGAKQLIKILTGKEVPMNQYSSNIGIVILNVSTVYAIKRAVIDGEALTERVVTLTGKMITKPGNIWVRLGTTVNHLLTYIDFIPTKEQRVIMGGPLMGFILPTLNVPIVKISNCLLVPSNLELPPTPPEQSCIRCGQCANVCPVNLLPQQLYWFSRRTEYDKARQHHLFDCIECGACAYVCPSNIPLVYYYRKQKAKIRTLDDETQRATMAKKRYEAKLLRLKREKQERLTFHQKALVMFNDVSLKEVSLQSAISEAIARVKSRRYIAQKSKIFSYQIDSLIACNRNPLLDSNKIVLKKKKRSPLTVISSITEED